MRRDEAERVQPSLRPATYWTALSLIVIAGTAVRLAAARGELWLDEIWSLRLAQLATTPLGIFTELHHDNNHHLNTLYLSWVPETARWLLYRLHSVVAGAGTILLAAAVARPAGDRAALSAALFTSGSFLLILYGSEARGYALAVFFACLAVVLAERFFSTGRGAWSAAFAVVCVLGILSHLTFLHAYAGLLLWTAVRTFANPRRPLRFAALHALPVAVLAGLYWIDLRHLTVGGGPPFTVNEIVVRTLSLSVGGPATGPLRDLLAIAALGAALAVVAAVRRSGSDLWILFAGTLAAPVVMLATVETTVLFERYFLVSVAFTLIATGWLAGRVAQRSTAAWSVLLVLFLAGNAAHTWRLIERGRSNYGPAITHMTASTPEGTVTVGGDHDFRHAGLLEFHQPFVVEERRIDYQPRSAWTREGPEWFLVHSQDERFLPDDEITVPGGMRYRLGRYYPSALLSGWHLAVYHRVRPNL